MLLSDKDGSANSPCLLSRTLPLQVAVRAGHAAIVALLLQQGADPAKADFPLHTAVECGHLEVVRLLLDAKCDPAARNARGRPPMALAAREDKIDIMELFLARYDLTKLKPVTLLGF